MGHFSKLFKRAMGNDDLTLSSLSSSSFLSAWAAHGRRNGPWFVMFVRRPSKYLWQWPCYPLVSSHIAMENGHRNSGFSHRKLWFSIAMLNYQRVKRTVLIPTSVFTGILPWSTWDGQQGSNSATEFPPVIDDGPILYLCHNGCPSHVWLPQWLARLPCR